MKLLTYQFSISIARFQKKYFARPAGVLALLALWFGPMFSGCILTDHLYDPAGSISGERLREQYESSVFEGAILGLLAAGAHQYSGVKLSSLGGFSIARDALLVAKIAASDSELESDRYYDPVMAAECLANSRTLTAASIYALDRRAHLELVNRGTDCDEICQQSLLKFNASIVGRGVANPDCDFGKRGRLINLPKNSDIEIRL